MIVAAFVGYYPDLEHLFSAGPNHGHCQMDLHNMKDDCNIEGYPAVPEFFGFVDYSDGEYRYVDRADAFQIAKANGQLKYPDDKSNTLNSYDILEYPRDHMFHLKALSSEIYLKLRKETTT